RQGIADAVEHLSALGHRRIGFLGGPGYLDSSQRRMAAFKEGAARAALSDHPAIESDYTVQGGYFACAKLLSRGKVTAIVSSNDLMAIGALHCAYDRGLAVPESLSVVGFDDIVFAQYTQPALTTVAVPRKEIGRLAFETIAHMHKDPSRPGVEHIAKTRLVVRQSTSRPSIKYED
ncbi:MAG: LacI family DNA-binding transcriptional regulator, partial [Bryobacteraceae bacterium]